MKRKTSQSGDNKLDKTKAGLREGIVSIILNTLLFALKIWAGTVSGSIALVADAWHTLSDSISSIIVVAAVKLSSKKADKEHPFGHGRWEQIAALFIAVFLGVIGFDFAKLSVLQLTKKERVDFGILAIIVTIISIVAKELLAQYAFYIARKTENESVRADGWHHRTDALSSAVVLVGILFARQFWWIDSVLGMIIAAMIFHAAFEILRNVINKMLGEEPTQEFIDSITKDIITYYEDDMQLHHLHLHNYISHKELTMHIRLNKDLTIENGHEIASAIERLIQDNYQIAVTVHVEPLLYRKPNLIPPSNPVL